MQAEKSWGEGAKLGHAGALDHLVATFASIWAGDRLVGVGHRVVHGGLEYSQPVRVDAGVLQALEKFVPLAPLHQPHNLAPIRLLLERAPQLPQVACFDTSFHRSNPEIAQMFALPAELHAQGIRRYGFHGLSYEYIASVLPSFDAKAAAGRTVVLHLGNGASMCAIRAGKSVASTMGFTAVEGLPMGTRCGSRRPRCAALSHGSARDGCARDREAHLQPVRLAGGVRHFERHAHAAGERAIRAPSWRSTCTSTGSGASWARSPRRWAAWMRSCSPPGIGENAAVIRERVCRDAAWLGVELDAAANSAGGPRISAPASRVSAWVIPTNEELMIARHTRALLAG